MILPPKPGDFHHQKVTNTTVGCNKERFHVSAFRMGPAASERSQCDIDRVLFGVTKSRVRKLGSSYMTKILIIKPKTQSYRYISVRDNLFFDT